MAEVSPKPVNQKRKLDVEDSEDELFLNFENERKKKASLENKSEIKENNLLDRANKDDLSITQKKVDLDSKLISKESPSKPLSNKILNIVTESSVASSPKHNNDSTKSIASTVIKSPMVQTKISFIKGKDSPKPAGNQQTKAVPNPVPVRPNGEWFIQDYLYDEQWRKLLKDEFEKDYFQKINNHIKDGYKKNINRPPKELVFNALNSTSLKDILFKIKVVIIGQDPYHDDNQAHGLCFSVPKGIALPPSLKNIFKELKDDIPTFERDESLGGCLQKWTEEGVFLLNTFLTVEAHKAASHSQIGWDKFTDQVIRIISEKNSGCVFFLWGRFAQQKEGLIDKKKHKVLKCAHPSPFSATKFFGSKCFSQANTYLKSIGKQPVNWSLKN